MSIFHAFDINASGLTAQRYRMDVISENVANASTTRTQDGSPYRRKVVTFAEKSGQHTFSNIFGRVTAEYDAGHRTGYGVGYMSQCNAGHSSGQGVKVISVSEDHVTPMNMVYDPSHPDADENGYVTYPNVNIITEMTNMIDASRAYEANSTAFSASKSMAVKGLDLIGG